MIHSRFQVIVSSPSSNAPDIQDGLPTSRLVGPKIDAHRLLQDQRHAPGGEQRLERPAVEEADDAALDGDADQRRRPGRRAAAAISQRPVEQAGARGADELLDDEGRVGAEHDHLAMRHVDDAHHAEGDGEADRGQQQHRAERDAVPDVLRRRPRSPASRSMSAIAAVGRVLQRAVGAGRERRSAATARRGRRARAMHVDRRELVGLAAASDVEHGGGARLLERAP